MAKRHIEQANLVGVWLKVFPNILNSITLSDEKFWENDCLCFRMEPLGIQRKK